MDMEKKFKRVHSICGAGATAALGKMATASAAARQFFKNKGLNI